MENLPPDHFATTGAYTPHIHRDQYPAVDPKSPTLSQSGKVIIITGASAGIGSRGFAPAFAKAKPKALILVARDAKKLSVTEKLVIDAAGKGSVEVVCFGADVSKPADVERLYEMVKSKYGHADVLVNNAGVMSTACIAPIGDVQDIDAWWWDYEVNVRGTFLMTRGFLNLLGHERKGTVISMISSIVASAVPAMSAYAGSKLAVARISENVAVEYPSVTSVCLQPGVVKTDAVIGPFERFAQDTPELVGGTGVWLSTDGAHFLSGRFVSANWDVEDLVKRKEEILGGNDLKFVYQGNFGLDQFK